MKTTLLILLAPAIVSSAPFAQTNDTKLDVPAPGSRDSSFAIQLVGTTAPPAPPFPGFGAMHAEFVHRFEESPGFGRSRIIMPRFLTPLPTLVLNGSNGPAYQVVSPDLLGLEEDSVAYSLNSHAELMNQSMVRMGDGSRLTTNSTRSELRRHFKKRPLTAQETKAVLALRQGQELVVLTNRVTLEPDSRRLATGPDLLVMGALRASATCAQCHQCAEKTLLGAFSYLVTPVIPQPKYSNVTARIGHSANNALLSRL